ncbi:hypothetical protein K470DRAFT_257762 [Piedraia hortae CBS 480.64]|uniref:Mediator of RNA polymerase II transcription subunit 13 n=1 Tax=Piedraia hortae CBS 480.64 TaxID=1314780 RepID=A0A6A7BZ53_9PEZI|nr:hypothetical protein K470DRAFT_257762 [Piedraia hortae CBS 480.64]
MEVFQDCHTNVQIWSDIKNVQFTIQKSLSPGECTIERHCSVISKLRRCGVLCTSVKDEVWIFNSDDEVWGFEKVSSGTVRTGNKHDDRVNVGNLFDAIEGAVSFELGQLGVVRLGRRTWIVTRDGRPGKIVRLRLEIAENGDLYATKIIEETDFREVEGLAVGTEVLLSPKGLCATVVEESRAISKEKWQSLVGYWLSTEGITIEGDVEWQTLRSANHVVFTWPASLCFARSKSSDHGDEVIGSAENQDPLIFAEDWFLNAGMWKQSPVAEEPLVEPDTLPGSVDELPPIQQATLNGIYLTPEDQIMLSQTTHQMDDGNATQEMYTGGTMETENDLPSFNSENDDLFGEGGENSNIGVEEVGDADFDFFNEQKPSLTSDVVMLDEVHESPSSNANGGEEEINREPSVDSTEKRLYKSPERPMTPFTIKERLLPPPVPVSANMKPPEKRRKSTYEPIIFRSGLDIGRRFSEMYGPPAHPQSITPFVVNIHLPVRKKKRRLDSSDSDSDDDSTDSTSSSSNEMEMPPKMPWDKRRKKRLTVVDQPEASPMDVDHPSSEEEPEEKLLHLLESTITIPPPLNPQKRKKAPLPPNLTKTDLINIAQLISEQSISCVPTIVSELTKPPLPSTPNRSTAIQDLINNTLTKHGLKSCPISQLALPRPIGTQPQIALLPAPHIETHRGASQLSLNPISLNFWEILALSPPCGAKDILATVLFPDSLHEPIKSLLTSISASYETNKLGTHTIHALIPTNSDSYPAELSTLTLPLPPKNSHNVIYLFTSGEVKSLCAEFYVQVMKCAPAILQILPTSLLGEGNLTAKQLALIAKEVYDRCEGEAWVKLMRSTPRKVPFGFGQGGHATQGMGGQSMHASQGQGIHAPQAQGSLLLLEGSAMHLAYAYSANGEWVHAAWSDSEGGFRRSAAYCLRGRRRSDVFAKIWERACGFMARLANGVGWKIYVLAFGAGRREGEMWKGVMKEHAKVHRGRAWSISYLEVERGRTLRVVKGECEVASEVVDEEASTPATAGTGTATPAATGTATATAAAAAAAAEGEENAVKVLVDEADEVAAVLFADRKMSVGIQSTAMARGGLFQRAFGKNEILDSLEVNLIWTLQLRQDNIKECAKKQCQATLWETLKLYRGLGVLAKARGWKEFGPEHLVRAKMGASGLDGL